LITTDDNNESARLLEELYREVGPKLLAYFCRRHAGRPVAEDLLHETFMAAMKHPQRLLLAASPRAYLFGVARNLSMDAYRGARPTEELTPEVTAAAWPEPDARLEGMRRAIGRLNSVQREVLELRLDQELSYEEIGVVLGIPVGTVRSRLHHAVRQLRERLLRGDKAKANEAKHEC
jgi:RNA polymerase sigma-70 factor (ECF subfamily)